MEDAVNSTDLTLNDLIEVYLRDKKREVRETTYMNLSYAMSRLGNYVSPKAKLDSLTGVFFNVKLKDAPRGLQVITTQLLKYGFKYDYLEKDISIKIRLNPPIKKAEKLYFEK